MPTPRIDNFSGGETDRFRENQDPKFYKLARNMYINDNNRLESRPGYGGVRLADPKPWGVQRVDQIWNHISNETTVGTNSKSQRYETFVTSSGAVMRNSDDTTAWTPVLTAQGANNLPTTDPSLQQTNYIRLNDNEFVVTSGPFKHTTKFYRQSINTEWKYVSLGLPRLDDDDFVTVQVGQTGGGLSFSWALVLKHTYTLYEAGSGFITKIVRGSPAIASYEDLTAPTAGNSYQISLPNLTGNESAYVDNEGDTVSDAFFEADGASNGIVFEVYRTTANGSVFYKVGEAEPGTSFDVPVGGSLGDGVTDADLVAGELLYTTDGVFPNGMVSRRPVMGTFANDCLWLASNSRVWQSKIGIYDAFPGSFNFNCRQGEYITAINSIDIYPIVFTNQGVYRVEGIVDDLGNGTHRVRVVAGAESKGALSNRTTVKADNSILYWSIDGIYETNGYTTRKISEHYDDRYCDIFEKQVTYNDGVDDHTVWAWEFTEGCYDPKERRVHWFYPRGPRTDTRGWDSITVHMEHKHEEGYAITSGDVDEYAVTGTSAAFEGPQIITHRGSVLRQYPDRNNDVPWDTDGMDAVGQSVEWDYISTVMAFGTDLVRKWFTRLLLNFKNHGDLTFSVESDTDESGDWRAHNRVEERGVTTGYYMLKRGFPKGKLRGAYKQIRFSNATAESLPNVTVGGEKVELNSYTIIFGGSGEGHTQSPKES